LLQTEGLGRSELDASRDCLNQAYDQKQTVTFYCNQGLRRVTWASVVLWSIVN